VADKVIYMHQGLVWEEGDASILSDPQTPELRQFIGTGL
jgi:polar amino acid transport system ATP-binding protein